MKSIHKGLTANNQRSKKDSNHAQPNTETSITIKHKQPPHPTPLKLPLNPNLTPPLHSEKASALTPPVSFGSAASPGVAGTSSVPVPTVTPATISSTAASAISTVPSVSTATVASTTTVVATFTTAAAAAAASAGLRLVDGDIAAVELLAVHSFDGVPHRLLVVEGHESEPSGSACLTVIDDLSDSKSQKSDQIHY